MASVGALQFSFGNTLPFKQSICSTKKCTLFCEGNGPFICFISSGKRDSVFCSSSLLSELLSPNRFSN